MGSPRLFALGQILQQVGHLMVIPISAKMEKEEKERLLSKTHYTHLANALPPWAKTSLKLISAKEG